MTKFESSAAKNKLGSSFLRHALNKEGLTNVKAKVKDDLEDIPMAYLGYVLLTIMAMAVAAVVLVIRLF